MMKAMWLALLPVLAASVSGVAVAQSSPIEQEALITGVGGTTHDPCTSNGGGGNDLSKYWGLQANKSRFSLVNRSGLKYRIKAKAHLKKLIEAPNFYLLNTASPPVDLDPCGASGDVSTHFFAFGIHDIEDPHTHTIGPHAIIYIPMNLQHVKPLTLGDSFVLMVLHVEQQQAKCQAYSAEDQDRCNRLNEIATLMSSGEADSTIMKAIVDAMPAILPATSLRARSSSGHGELKSMTATFMHNGVIHGNL